MSFEIICSEKVEVILALYFENFLTFPLRIINAVMDIIIKNNRLLFLTRNASWAIR